MERVIKDLASFETHHRHVIMPRNRIAPFGGTHITFNNEHIKLESKKITSWLIFHLFLILSACIRSPEFIPDPTEQVPVPNTKFVTEITADPSTTPETLLSPRLILTSSPLITTSTPLPEATPTSPLDFYQQLREKYALSIEDIPTVLKTGQVAYSPIFRNIPEIQALRDGMFAAPPSEKWIYVAQIVAHMGVQTKEELQGNHQPELRVARWHSYAENGQRLLTCNTYATTVMHALGLGEDISHWFSPQGVPQFNAGIEYQARQTQRWLQDRGEEFHWQDVSMLSLEERLELLRNGYIILGVNQIHMWLIFGAVDEEGQTRAVLTQSIPNALFSEPWGSEFQSPLAGTLFAHKLP